jgi:hypothetical protein
MDSNIACSACFCSRPGDVNCSHAANSDVSEIADANGGIVIRVWFSSRDPDYHNVSIGRRDF